MNRSELEELLKEYGMQVNNGLIICNKFQYGRLTDNCVAPVEPGDYEPIPYDSFDRVTLEKVGKEQDIRIIKNDGSDIRLRKHDYIPPSRSLGFVFNSEGRPLMPDCIANLKAVWPTLYPDFNQYCWKDETTCQTMIDKALIGEQGIEELTVPVSLRLTAMTQDRLKDLGCVGRVPNKDLVWDVVYSLSDLNVRNPILEMMRTEIWDGNPRVDRLFIDVFGGRMDNMCQADSDKVLTAVSRSWFLGAVARQHRPVQIDIIPILMGLTNIGKSTATQWLACVPELYGAPLSMNEKKFVEESRGKLILELTEMNATKGVDIDYLKGFLSKDTDFIRLSYEKCARRLIRRYVVIGTTNESEFLNDYTGNRRFFPFEVSPERSIVGFKGGFRSEEARHYILQVWAEAYQRYLKGEPIELPKEIVMLAKPAQDAAMVNNPDVDILAQLLDVKYPLPGELVCMKDLIYLLGQEMAVYGDEAKIAAKAWWDMPHKEWGKSGNQRVGGTGHEWVKGSKVSVKCRERIHPVGYVEPEVTKRLGE